MGKPQELRIRNPDDGVSGALREHVLLFLDRKNCDRSALRIDRQIAGTRRFTHEMIERILAAGNASPEERNAMWNVYFGSLPDTFGEAVRRAVVMHGSERDFVERWGINIESLSGVMRGQRATYEYCRKLLPAVHIPPEQAEDLWRRERFQAYLKKLPTALAAHVELLLEETGASTRQWTETGDPPAALGAILSKNKLKKFFIAIRAGEAPPWHHMEALMDTCAPTMPGDDRTQRSTALARRRYVGNAWTHAARIRRDAAYLDERRKTVQAVPLDASEQEKLILRGYLEWMLDLPGFERIAPDHLYKELPSAPAVRQDDATPHAWPEEGRDVDTVVTGDEEILADAGCTADNGRIPVETPERTATLLTEEEPEAMSVNNHATNANIATESNDDVPDTTGHPEVAFVPMTEEEIDGSEATVTADAIPQTTEPEPTIVAGRIGPASAFHEPATDVQARNDDVQDAAAEQRIAVAMTLHEQFVKMPGIKLTNMAKKIDLNAFFLECLAMSVQERPDVIEDFADELPKGFVRQTFRLQMSRLLAQHDLLPPSEE